MKKRIWWILDTAVWQVGERTLLVSYKNNGAVAVCGLKNADGSSAE